MNRPDRYNTRQRKAILAYIASLDGGHVKAADIVAHFGKGDVAVSRTTVYRHLEKLTAAGSLRKYTIDGVSGACYQYADKADECREHFHLKCEMCGELRHLRCGTLDGVRRHVSETHSFEVNSMRTVFYGKCADCQNKVKP